VAGASRLACDRPPTGGLSRMGSAHRGRRIRREPGPPEGASAQDLRPRRRPAGRDDSGRV